MSDFPSSSLPPGFSADFQPFDIFLLNRPGSAAPLMAFATIAPFFIGFCLLNSIVFYRSFHAFLCLCGLIFSTVINNALKNFLEEPRPLGSLKVGYGNPSDHAQFLTFFTVYWIFMQFQYSSIHRPLRYEFLSSSQISRFFPLGLGNSLNGLFSLAIPCLLIAGAFLGIYSRHFFSAHSPKQLINGVLFGLFNGFSFAWAFSPSSPSSLFHRILQGNLMKSLSFKDNWKFPDGLERERILYEQDRENQIIGKKSEENQRGKVFSSKGAASRKNRKE